MVNQYKVTQHLSANVFQSRIFVYTYTAYHEPVFTNAAQLPYKLEVHSEIFLYVVFNEITMIEHSQ